jgi:hypothetical protein
VCGAYYEELRAEDYGSRGGKQAVSEHGDLPHRNSGDSSAPVTRAPLNDVEMVAATEAMRQRVATFSRRAAPLYKQLDWVWGMDTTGIPTHREIAKALHELIDGLRPWDCAPHKARVESGGLYAEVEREAEGHIRAAVGFCDEDATWLDAIAKVEA